MRYLIISVMLLTSSLSYSQLSYEDEINGHREKINREFSDSTTTILNHSDLADFHGLDFFAPDASYKVQAKFKRIKKGKVIGFATSTDRIAKYRAYGIISFKVDGKKCQLTVYEPAQPIKGYEDHLFLPFNDMTNGDTTYGGGRYLDLSKKDMKKKMTLDFNYCYNPYCAYSDGYSCPVPPDNNKLGVEIKAGVKAYGEHH